MFARLRGVQELIPADRIAARIEVLARDIAAARLENPLLVGILDGSFMFAADLARALHRGGGSLEVDFLGVSSYGGGQVSTGSVTVVRDLGADLRNRDVLLVDDVLDSGRTLDFVRNLINSRGARRVLTCVLVDKQAPRAVPVAVDFAAFECPNVFVVGYGMDCAGRYRGLPFIGVLTG